MDQLKDILAVAKKYHFWILCGLIAVLYLGTWFLATSQVKKDTDTRISKINGDYSSGQSITAITNHPNDISAKMMGELNKAEAAQVGLAWDERFKAQANVLIWPEELLPDFIAEVDPLKPIELKVNYPTEPQDELAPRLKARYMDYIKAELPKLAEMVGARWMATGGGGGMGSGAGMGSGSGMGMGSGSGMGMGSGSGMGMGSGSGMGSGGGLGLTGDEEQKPLVVNWNSSNQGALQMAFEWGQSPSTLEILYAQEDLWLLHALMTIIKQTNGDADAQYNAAIKEIETIEFGASAAGIKVVGSVSSPGSSGGTGYDNYEGGGSGSGMGSGSPSMNASAGGSGAAELDPGGVGGGYMSGAEQVSPDPADKRYVDTKNEPLEATRLRTAMESATASDAFLVVAKRMPVRMRFKMDLMKLPLLMVNCANSALPFEIRQVRINAPAAASGGMGGSGGMMGSGPSSGPMGAGSGSGAGMDLGAPGGGGDEYDSGGGSGGYGSGGGFGSGSGGYGSGGPAQNVDSPYDGTVELYGIVYIYNPVDANKLGLQETAAATDASASPTGSPAAGAPATGAPAADTTADPTADSGTTPAAGSGPATGSGTNDAGGDGAAAAG